MKTFYNDELEQRQSEEDCIQYIQNPSEYVNLQAVKENGYAVQYIKNPSEETKLAAVQWSGFTISKI